MIGITGSWGWAIVVAAVAFYGWSMVLLHKTGAFWSVGSVLTAWLIAAFAFGEPIAIALGERGLPPPLVIGGVALVSFGAAFAVAARWRGRVLELPVHLLIAPQALRIAGATFFLAGRDGIVGWEWAWPTAFFDVLVGTSAAVATVMSWRRLRGWRAAALLPIVFAVLDGIASGRAGVHLPLVQLRNLGRFPITMISAFALPLSTVLLVVLAARLWRERGIASSALEVAR